MCFPSSKANAELVELDRLREMVVEAGRGAVVLLGVSIAATALIEGVLGIVAYLRALLVAVLATAVALIIAAYVNQQRVLAARRDARL